MRHSNADIGSATDPQRADAEQSQPDRRIPRECTYSVHQKVRLITAEGLLARDERRWIMWCLLRDANNRSRPSHGTQSSVRNRRTTIRRQHLPRCFEAADVPNQQTTMNTEAVMQYIVSNNWVSKMFLTDQEPRLGNEELRGCLKKLGIRRLKTAHQHSHTNYPTESNNTTIKEGPAAKGSDWIVDFPLV
ncbi:gap-Pol polyprotein [Clonorchis sinensis]|uniref:Gap-Pol polyprotein n=1 Tax=Clonorchis sinensis TaxID=79923 RepID=G7YU91_CLOSI|nr:gap-Pol polyprotein [Clonorchis sinensis]